MNSINLTDALKQAHMAVLNAQIRLRSAQEFEESARRDVLEATEDYIRAIAVLDAFVVPLLGVDAESQTP